MRWHLLVAVVFERNAFAHALLLLDQIDLKTCRSNVQHNVILPRRNESIQHCLLPGDIIIILLRKLYISKFHQPTSSATRRSASWQGFKKLTLCIENSHL